MSRKERAKPLILDFYGFKDEHHKFLEQILVAFPLKCNFCKSVIRASIKITSNWVGHLRTNHPEEFKNYSELKEKSAQSFHVKRNVVANLHNFVRVTKKFNYNHPIQRKLDKQLVRLVVNSSMPLSLIDHPDFKLFLYQLNSQFRTSSRKRLSNTLVPMLYNDVFNKINLKLKESTTVTVTVDAWTDARMKAFLGVTGHIIDKEWNCLSFLLECKRIHDNHTSENIKNNYMEIINKFDLGDKISHIITDNAANMVAAFKKTSLISSNLLKDIEDYSTSCDEAIMDFVERVNYEHENNDEECEDDTLCDASDSQSTDSCKFNYNLPDSIFSSISCGAQRLSCIAHTLQLVIKDALSDVTQVERAIETVARLISGINRSYLSKEKVEKLNKFFVKKNETRWNSQYLMIKSFLEFSEEELEFVFERRNVITAVQRNVLQELVLVLEDFSVITNLIQTDKFSIGHILPLIRGLKYELNKLPYLRYCDKIKSNLLNSLDKRFNYLEANSIYPLAAILTPAYGKKWLKPEEINKWDNELLAQLEIFLSNHPLLNNDQMQNKEITEPCSKKIKCLSYLNDSQQMVDQTFKKNQINFQDYINQINKSNISCLNTQVFWQKHESDWPELAAFAKFVLNIPATSAPVERIFSVGGAILRPSRRCLGDDLFEKLMFLKCNLNLFKN
ncbi:unnamed protein product [Brachionus calyciflorus]|uniref:HAT C-terminal dimerisation domain-containing protein n=1 Tax=Brachionus calyciflorus TaxID=104777 RepID=A0A814PNY6_9BILA|nr:unnamed protein product [Brachionus calyciflorus]